MNTEKKTYAVIGKVEIGTDEYRDLIEGLAEAKAEASRNDTERWKEYRRASEAEAKLKELETKYAPLNEFIRSDEAILTKYKLYQLEKLSEEQAVQNDNR